LLCLRVFVARENSTCEAFESKGDQPVAPTFFSAYFVIFVRFVVKFLSSEGKALEEIPHFMIGVDDIGGWTE